ncbi:MAG: hypothetical protein KY410_04370, partial [Proteobacteria bacterium]|nr:hypothetical protein [Pseudomonadota bacterium]
MNISRLIIGSLAISLLVASSFAVGAELRTFAIHNLHFEKFKAHGHDAEAVIHAVHEDRKGRLWIGSEAALYLYDGHEVRSFVHAPEQYSGLPNNFAKSIAEAPNGTIWIGTWGGGLAWFDEATRKIRVPRMTTGEVGNKPFDQKVWSMLVDRNGIVWLGTFSSGLFRFDPDTDELKAVWQPGEGDDPRAARIDSLFLDDADNLWFSPYGGGIRVIDTGSGLDAEGVDVEQLNSVSRDVSDIAAFPDGRVVVSYRSAFAVFDQEGHKLLAVDVPLANKDGVIMEALPYGENQVLFGAGNRLWFADIATGVSFPLPAGARPGAVDESIIWDMDVTFDGDLLVAGTHGVSISTAPSRQFWTLALLEGGGDFFNITRAIEFDGTHLYLNSSQSLYQIEFDGQFGQPRVLQGQKLMDVPFGRPLSMRTAPGEGYWAGTDRALYFVDAINTPHTVLEQPTHNMLFDAQYNRLLLHPPGGIRAVSAATPNQPSAEHEDEAELDRRRLSALRLSFGANSDIWAGTFTSLHRYDRDTLESLPAFTPHVEGDGWNGSLVGHIEPIDGGQILLGTSTGPYLAETNDEGAIHRLKHLFANSRLGTVSFSGVFPLGDNRYIMFSDLGFVRFSLENESPPELLSNFDGIPFYRPYIGGFRRFEGGLAVFSGEEGPLLIKPAELDFSVPQRQLVVTDILSFRGDSTETWPITDNLKFRHEDKVIRFRFGMLDHLSADNNEFQIRLKGFAEDWLDLGRVRDFSFTNLDPGEYVLEIRGIDGGLRVPEVETLSFTVLPPWWQTWWAYTLYALVIFGSLFLYWLSLQRKIVREKEISGRL